MIGRGVEKDPSIAAQYYEMAADQDHPQSQYNLAFAYEHGVGIQRDVETSMEWYEASAEQGIPIAQFRLGTAYLEGEEGIDVDPVGDDPATITSQPKRGHSIDQLAQWFGSSGPGYRRLAQGLDFRPVVSSRQRKSCSVENTFARDIVDAARVRAWIAAGR